MAEFDAFDRLTKSFTPDDPATLLSAAASFGFGYAGYVYCIRLLLNEGKGPYPLWMHLFYLAHDATWSYLCAKAAPLYGDHWVLRGCSTALGLWCALEVFCIYKAMTVERAEIYGPLFGKDRNPPWPHMLVYTGSLLAVMFAVVHLFIEFVGPQCMFHWFAFTNLVFAVGPTDLWLRRRSRDGLSVGLALVNVGAAVFTFAPFGMWVRIFPEIFNNSVYYLSGVVVVAHSMVLALVVWSYPPKKSSGIW